MSNLQDDFQGIRRRDGRRRNTGTNSSIISASFGKHVQQATSHPILIIHVDSTADEYMDGLRTLKPSQKPENLGDLLEVYPGKWKFVWFAS